MEWKNERNTTVKGELTDIGVPPKVLEWIKKEDSAQREKWDYQHHHIYK